MKALPDVDRAIAGFDRALRTLFARATSARPIPGAELQDARLEDADRRKAAALMRVNHAGEVCAQALYHGQALTARSEAARQTLEHAAAQETEHLAWTGERIAELGGRTSLLNPVLYAGSFAIGAASGLLGDKWNLGFLAETEKQVEGHLEGHLDRLPADDRKSRAIVEQMKQDEAGHARAAVDHGAAELPLPAKHLMRIASRIMTKSTYWV
ncbi:MAG TPA: 2-polyprenyl-3-methyl-6-methoxy-1,4-benzoquinone monooxygenase [Burkholderiales bacterium]|nr:2-polyprenyl-3-methyl-6-methoxy-1,4-benzoquinone monooxygenase [Burkholderiales bacterium]